MERGPRTRRYVLETLVFRLNRVNEEQEAMVHDRDYFRRRAAEARAAAFQREEGEDSEVAGQLALAYAALARRQSPAPAMESVATEEAEA